MKERLTTYHCGKAVIKDKNKLSEAIEKLAEFEEKDRTCENCYCAAKSEVDSMQREVAGG